MAWYDYLFGNSGGDEFTDADTSVKNGMSGVGYGVPLYGGSPTGSTDEANRASFQGQEKGNYMNLLANNQRTDASAFGGQAGADRQGQLDSLGRLQNFYQQGPGPSAAEAQLRNGADQSMANSLALARSGRGAGGNAMAMRNAGFQNAATMQQTNGQAAALRAQESANWRGQQAQAMGMEQQGYGNLRAGDIQGMGMKTNAGLGYDQLAGQQWSGGEDLRNRIMQGQMGADASRYGADQGVSINNTNIQADKDKSSANFMGNIMGGGLSLVSDIRAKKDIAPAEASSSLRDVFGRDEAPAEPYGREDIRDPWANDLRPAQAYSYVYKDPNAAGAAPGRHISPMAQDLEKTPAGASAVVNTPQGKKVDTGRLTMVNSSAISETQKRQDDQDARMKQLYDLLDNAYARQGQDRGSRF